MILLQEIPWLSQGDILLHVRLQHYEPNTYLFLQKKLHFMRNLRSKVIAGATKTKSSPAECEQSVKRAFHSFENKHHMSSVACTVMIILVEAACQKMHFDDFCIPAPQSCRT
jgi:hypothetical protein